MARILSSFAGVNRTTPTTTVTGGYTAALSDFLIRANNPGPGELVIQIPAVDGTVRGHAFIVKKIDSNADVRVTSVGADTFDGAASITLTALNQSVMIIAPESGTDWTIVVLPASTSSGGTTVGTATIDFGGTASSSASVTVTGQAAILATSHVTAFLQQDTTVDNDADDHLTLAIDANFYVSSVIAGTGFTINVFLPNFAAKGTYKVRWMWV